MKKIDRLLLQSFLPPFVVTFFIALFVLIMQFLWTYIDDIIGKGVGFWVMVELLSYLSISLIPTALPIAILISSVMVMGNLAERYELASMKSAGIPLLRIMQPLMILSIGITIFSFFCSNNLIPLANLQFKSRLYDIRKQKPALNLETGIFNDDFKGFVIHIGEKAANNRDIGDVIIYDHSRAAKEPMHLVARKGEMYNTDDGNYFVMTLYDGTQYQENKQQTKGKDKSYPFTRTSFKKWTKVFDLEEFSLQETDIDLFDSHYTMLNIGELKIKIDSLDQKIENRLVKVEKHMAQYISIFKEDTIATTLPEDLQVLDAPVVANDNAPKDSNKIVVEKAPTPKKVNQKPVQKTIKKTESKKPVEKDSKKEDPQEKAHKKATGVSARPPLAQNIDQPLESYNSFVETFVGKNTRRNLVSKAQSYARNIQSQNKSSARQLHNYKEGRVKHIYELHSKFSMAVVCFVFLFIGAPMGAIVRKGGFGYPLLIAIIFFMLYIVLNVFCKKLAESLVLPAEFAAWIPCGILFPVGLLLTYKAMNDSKMINADRYLSFLLRLVKMLNGA